MDWHYIESGKSQGPVSEEKLIQLMQRGTVTPSTLIWKDGMADWKPCGEVGPKASAASDGGADASTEKCAQCGKAFNRDEMLKFENSWVCVNCKPVFLQKLKEGVRTDGSLVYGGFWIRLGAKFIDGILLQILNYATTIPLVAMMGSKAAGTPLSFVTFVPIILSFIIQMAFITFFLGRFGATPGKMACRLKVVNPDGSRISYMKAFGRYWGEMVSAFTMSIGYLIAAWDEEKRALHDRICNTRVIRVS